MEKKDRIREGEFRSYVFTAEEVLRGTERFLRTAGYVLLPSSSEEGQPDFYAQRQAGKTNYRIAGIVQESIDQAPEAFSKLKRIKSNLGKEVDCVLVLPPINEYLLLEFLLADRGKWYFDMKEEEFMLWLSNPEDGATWCFLGGPLDRELEKHFTLSKFSVDIALHARLSQQLLLEEEGGMRG